MINRAVLVGRLTKDIEVRYTGNGTAVGSFIIAVNRQFKNAQGEREADFINCVVWRKAAETLAEYTHKGSQIGIDGRIQTRNYENDQGQKVYVTEVVVDNFSLLDSKGSNQNESSQQPSYGQANQNNQSGSYNQNKPDPFKADSVPLDISDDDLPF